MTGVDLAAWRERLRDWPERMTLAATAGELRQLIGRIELLEASLAFERATIAELRRDNVEQRMALVEAREDAEVNTVDWTRTLDQLDYHKAREAFWRTRAAAWKRAAKKYHRLDWPSVCALHADEATFWRMRAALWKRLAKLNRGRAKTKETP